MSYEKLRVNGEPYISMNGEIICDEYLPEKTIMNPPTSFGWFIYMIFGGTFDRMDEMTNQFLNDCDMISANPKSLDRFYGESLNLPRPTLIEHGEERYLTDEEYAVYMYLRNSQLITTEDLLSVFSHCMGDNILDDPYKGVSISSRVPNKVWYVVDHPHYTSVETPKSNLHRNRESDLDKIVDHLTDDECYYIPGQTEYTGHYLTYVNVPAKGWSNDFLAFLTDYISIKGNVRVREVVL